MTDLFNLKILMLAPCLGKFGGIETFCLTLIEDLIRKGASVRLLRKKVAGFLDDGSIQKNESEIRSSWTEKEANNLPANFFHPEIRSSKRPSKNLTSSTSTTPWWRVYGMPKNLINLA